MRLHLLLSILLLAVGHSVLGADAPESKSAYESDPVGWEDYLPPADFSGWKRVPIDPLTKDSPWKSDGKLLVCNSLEAKEMLLCEKDMGDGVFHVEWRFLKEVPGQKMYNGGIYVRTALDGLTWVQAQVANTPMPPRTGDMFAEFLTDGKKTRLDFVQKGAPREKPIEEWNTTEVTCKGKSISVWVNGATTLSWDDCPFPKGHLGFQAEFARLEIRVAKFKAAK